jgi:hypothetical protein
MGTQKRLSHPYRVVIIEESLEDKNILNKLKILSTEVADVTD